MFLLSLTISDTYYLIIGCEFNKKNAERDAIIIERQKRKEHKKYLCSQDQQPDENFKRQSARRRPGDGSEAREV